MKLKVAHSSAGLCGGCKHGGIITGSGKEVVICSRYDMMVSRPVERCTSYQDAKVRPVQEYYDAAWVLRTDKLTKSIGFKPWKEMSREEKEASGGDEYGD